MDDTRTIAALIIIAIACAFPEALGWISQYVNDVIRAG